MKCINCGAELIETANFCRYCGAAQGIDDEPTIRDPRTSPRRAQQTAPIRPPEQRTVPVGEQDEQTYLTDPEDERTVMPPRPILRKPSAQPPEPPKAPEPPKTPEPPKAPEPKKASEPPVIPVEKAPEKQPEAKPKKKRWPFLLLAIAAAALVAVAVLFFTGVLSFGGRDDEAGDDEEEVVAAHEDVELKVAFLLAPDSSGRDESVREAAESVCSSLGVEYVIQTNLRDGEAFRSAAGQLADEGYGLIIGTAPAFEADLIEAARSLPDVQFCVLDGRRAHSEGLDNYHNAAVASYEGRYLAGVAAGMKLNELLVEGKASEPKLGFVGPEQTPDVISAYTAFYLGAKSTCDSVQMEVACSDSRDSAAADKTAAEQLLADGCAVLGQFSDTTGVPEACETAGVPCVPGGPAGAEACPTTWLAAAYVDWRPCFEELIRLAQEGEALPTDWCGSLEDGSVTVPDVSLQLSAIGTQEIVDDTMNKLRSGALHVFALDTFTVGGEALETCRADTDGDGKADDEAVSGGYFHECELCAAPYFDLLIDGVTVAENAEEEQAAPDAQTE